MTPQARLNPEAPSFFPNQHHKLLPQPIPAPCFATHHYFSRVHDTLLQTYIPTLAPPPLITSTTSFDHDSTTTPTNTIIHQLNTGTTLLPPSEPAPTTRSEKQQHKEEVLVVGFENEGCSKGVAVAQNKEHVSKGIKGNGRIMDGGDGGLMRPVRRFAWRKKGATADDEERQKYYCQHFRSLQFFRREEQSFDAFPKKTRGFPVLPVREDGEDTTVMIKNIPAKYSRDKLVKFLDNHCMVENGKEEGKNGDERIFLAFDFVYLPIDFRSGLNKGYAFVNFTSPKAAWKFNLTASNRKWDLFQSHKIREVVAARLQGKEELQTHFETMHFPCEYEEVLPVFYSPPRDGVIKEEPRTVGRLIRRRQL